MNAEIQGVIDHMDEVHHAMGLAIAAGDFVSVLEHTGDMELLAGKAAQDARVSAELQAETGLLKSAQTHGTTETVMVATSTTKTTSTEKIL